MSATQQVLQVVPLTWLLEELRALQKRHAQGKNVDAQMVASTREQLLTEGWNPGRGKTKHGKKADSRTED